MTCYWPVTVVLVVEVALAVWAMAPWSWPRPLADSTDWVPVRNTDLGPPDVPTAVELGSDSAPAGTDRGQWRRWECSWADRIAGVYCSPRRN